MLPDKRKWCCAYCSYNSSCQSTMITDRFFHVRQTPHSENPFERKVLMDQTKVSETSGIHWIHTTLLKSCQIAKVAWLCVLRLTSVCHFLQDQGYTQEDSIAQNPVPTPYAHQEALGHHHPTCTCRGSQGTAGGWAWTQEGPYAPLHLPCSQKGQRVRGSDSWLADGFYLILLLIYVKLMKFTEFTCIYMHW